MNYPLATNLANDMIRRLSMADDFFSKATEFDSYLTDYKEEYHSAMLSTIASRLPREDEEWRVKSIKFLHDRGIKI